jgi:hypothetical protein
MTRPENVDFVTASSVREFNVDIGERWCFRNGVDLGVAEILFCGF